MKRNKLIFIIGLLFLFTGCNYESDYIVKYRVDLKEKFGNYEISESRVYTDGSNSYYEWTIYYKDKDGNKKAFVLNSKDSINNQLNFNINE